MRGATERFLDAVPDGKISIHAPREGSDTAGTRIRSCYTISIHAPREGSDLVDRYDNPIPEISIHAPREGSDGWGSFGISNLF